MDEATYKIFDILSRRLGIPTSINEITKNIDEVYGKAHYANIHAKIKKLDKVLTLTKAGKSSLVSINFDNHMIIDMLAEMELGRKRDFLENKIEMQMLLSEINANMRSVPLISHILLMYPERNSKLNKVEMLIYLKKSGDRKIALNTRIQINTITNALHKAYNIRIDYMTLENEAFFDLLKSNKHNTIREMLHDKISILHPQDFWWEIKNATGKGINITAILDQTNPVKIYEKDIVFNLARLGYTEMGSKVMQGKLFCIEYIITSIIFHGDVRRMEAISVIIAKNPKINYDLLLFLARKFGFEGKILGILRALKNLIAYKIKSVDEPIRLLESLGTNETKVDLKSIKEKLELYNVTR